MAKGKARSQQRREQDEDALISDEFTIADSYSIASLSILGDFDDLDDGFDNTDEIIQRGNPGNEQTAAAAAARLQTLADILASLSEYTQEKRTAKREGILRVVFNNVTHAALAEPGYEVVTQYLSDILAACFYSLRPGQAPTEQYAACRVLESVSVVLGPDEDDFVERIQQPLERSVKAQRACAVRMAALRCMAVAATVCTPQDSHRAEALQDLCEELSAESYRNHDVPGALRATAWDCWALLATLSEDVNIAGQEDGSIGRGLVILERLRDCLNTTSDSTRDLRNAAGQVLAIIHEARLNLGDDDADLNTTARKYKPGSWEGSVYEDIISEIQQRISELANSSGHHLSKKVLKAQRATFREFQATLVDDEAPEVVLNFRSNGSLTLSTWKEIVQLNFIRHCLQSGFQIQMLTNTTLQTMFGADPRLFGYNFGMSQIEKRLLLSKTSEASKLADQHRRGKRAQRERVKQHFLTADGEDI